MIRSNLATFGLLFAYATLPAAAFEGQIAMSESRPSQTNSLLYTYGADHLRIEITGGGWPNPVDIIDRKSGLITLLFPHNHSFARLKPPAESADAPPHGFPGMPMPPSGLPPGIGPHLTPFPSGQPGVNASLPSTPQIPQMPQPPQMPQMPAGVGPQPGGMQTLRPMPMRMMNQKLQLKATGQTTNILGFTCQRFELKQRGQTMTIWATDQLPAYQPYIHSQPHRFDPPVIEKQWASLLAEKKFFPLQASLRYDSGSERLRFEVTSVSAEKIAEPNESLFAPPPEYNETQPLPY